MEPVNGFQDIGQDPLGGFERDGALIRVICYWLFERRKCNISFKKSQIETSKDMKKTSFNIFRSIAPQIGELFRNRYQKLSS